MASVTALRKFVAPEFLFGVDARGRVGQYARNFGLRRVLVVSDPGVIQAGWTTETLESLAADGTETVVFSQLTPNPKDHEVAAGLALYQAEGCDGIVAVGGGSVIDCAKGIAILATNGGNILDYEGVDTIASPCPPLICIPTTAGTSADVSQFAIITDTTRQIKIAIISKAAVPDVALIDPQVTTTMDRELTVNTGMDAFTHAAEALASNASSLITDLHALNAVRLVCTWLPRAADEGMNIEARSQMMLASLTAGLAFSNASLGIVHAMAHALGGRSGLPHGACNALLLPLAVDYNFDCAPDAYMNMGQAMGLDLQGLRRPQAQERIVRAIVDLQRQLGVVCKLREMGLDHNLLPALAQAALADPCIITNPRPPTPQEVLDLYERAY